MTAAHPTGAAEDRLPDGFGIVLDPDTRRIGPGVLVGGSPARILRLSAAGQAALTHLEQHPVDSLTTGRLARRLTDAGAAHPVPPATVVASGEVTVVIPVRDRADMLARCLDALGGDHRVVVVDDGSQDRQRIAAVCAQHAATLVRREANGGPAVARNTGLAHLVISQVDSAYVAFLDSDCIPTAGWVDALAAHLADPMVAAVAPRILALPGPGSVGRFARAHGCLDLGTRPARVVPRSRVGYVPTAVLLVRRSALAAVARGGGDDVFDPGLRYGEDVDLIWRLHAAGWRIRYDPAVHVAHEEPSTWAALLARRFHYGTSAGPLALRHPGSLAPLVLAPWPALIVAGALWRRPAVAAIGLAAGVAARYRLLRRNAVPTRTTVPAALDATWQTAFGLGRYAVQFASPLIAGSLLAGGRRRHSRRLATVALALAPAVTDWVRERPVLDPVRFTVGYVADDLAYGTGVWASALRARTSAPLRPQILRRSQPARREPTDAAPASTATSTPAVTLTPATTLTPTRKH